jgi:hypothetical protein
MYLDSYSKLVRIVSRARSEHKNGDEEAKTRFAEIVAVRTPDNNEGAIRVRSTRTETIFSPSFLLSRHHQLQIKRPGS